jgi:hypothetical protein
LAIVPEQHPLGRAKKEDAMGVIVTADYVIGSKTNLTKARLKRITQALGIPDRPKLPTGRNARYVLVMETTAPTPSVVPVPQPKKGASKRKKRT